MKRGFFQKRTAFTFTEALVCMVIIGIISMSIVAYQTSSWSRSTKANRTIVAGHLIERQIEALRMQIERDSTKLPNIGDEGSIAENGVALRWVIGAATRPTVSGGTIDNARKCSLTAQWGASKGDTLTVTTYLSKKF